MSDQMFIEAARLQVIDLLGTSSTDSTCWEASSPASLSNTLVRDCSKWTSLALPTPEAADLTTFELTAERDYPGSPSSGTPQSHGRTDLSDFQFTKYQDAMTPNFFEASCTGKGISRVVIEYYQQTLDKPRMIYVFDGSNVSFHKIECDPRLPNTFVETVRLAWTDVFIYAHHSGESGDLYVSKAWSLRTNSNRTAPLGNQAARTLAMEFSPTFFDNINRVYDPLHGYSEQC